MIRRPLLALGLFVIALLAWLLRDTIAALIIIPLAYFWWLFKLYYAAIPQAVFWGLLAVLVLYSAVDRLIPLVKFRTARTVYLPPRQGQVEALARLIKKSERGTYYKWLIANRLGKTAREILAQREGLAIGDRFGALKGRDWSPPREIESYLDNGLNGSFADHPRRKWFWQKQIPTPLDVDIQQVTNYLEASLRGAERRSNPLTEEEIAGGLDTSRKEHAGLLDPRNDGRHGE